MGGGRIDALVERLSQLRTLDSYMKGKEKNDWIVGEGFQESLNGKPAAYITGQNYLSTEAFTEDGN